MSELCNDGFTGDSCLTTTNCDYSLLSANTHCDPACSIENLVNGTDQRWVNLRNCVDVNMLERSGTKQPVPVWKESNCASIECEQHFRDLISHCRACDTDTEFEYFLSLAGKNKVACSGEVASCGSMMNSLRDACCTGVDCASDGYPTICAYSSSSSRRRFGYSLCEEAVSEAEKMCPLHFLNNSRLLGLYVVSMAVIAARLTCCFTDKSLGTKSA